MAKQSKATPPFVLLADYLLRVQERSRELPGRAEAIDYWTGIGISLNGKRYVVAQEDVAEVLTFPHCTKVPGVKDWLLGIANVRGRLMSVMGLRQFLGYPEVAHESKNRLLVIDKGEVYTGVLVDEVLGIQHFVQNSFEKTVPPSNREDAIAPYLQGGVVQQDNHWTELSLHLLAASAAFLRAGKSA